jgi:enoyl-CoA hydratase/carnithine racemase
MNLVGDPVDAYEAHRVGLCNQVVPDHELFDTVLSWATKLAGQAPLAAAEIKKVSHEPVLEEGLRAEGEAFGRVFGSEDAREGIGAFLGKRRPRFQGR